MTAAGIADSYDRAGALAARRAEGRAAREERRALRRVARHERHVRADSIQARRELAELEALRLWAGSPTVRRTDAWRY